MAVYSPKTEAKALRRLEEGLDATRCIRKGRGNNCEIVEVPDYEMRIKCAKDILDRNTGKAPSTVNINDNRDETDKIKSPQELLQSMQANLPLIQSILQNMSDAAKTIDVTPLPRQLGNISQSDQPTDSVSGGSEAKPQ